MKKDDALQNEEIIVINQGGARKKYSHRKTGKTKKSDVTGFARGEWDQKKLIGA